MNKTGLILGAAALAGALSLAQGAPAQEAGGGKPNIVFMLADNLGYGELGCYGGGILAGRRRRASTSSPAEGMRLLNYNVEAQCTPSRSALMTGRFAIRSGTHPCQSRRRARRA